jgi:hypothetical protein
MATITRTREMFQPAVRTETLLRTGKRIDWKIIVRFVSWMLTPIWANDAAEQLAVKHNWPMGIHHPNIWV